MPYTQWRQRHFFVSLCGHAYGALALVLVVMDTQRESLQTLAAYFLVFAGHVFAVRSPLIGQGNKELFSLSFLLTANSMVVSATGGHIYAHMMFMCIACLVSLYKSSSVAGSMVVFSLVYYMLIGVASPGLIFTRGLLGNDAFEWSLVLFAGLVLVTTLSAVSWMLDSNLNENLLSLENAVTSTVLRDRQVNELQDNILQAIAAAMYLVKDEQSPVFRSLQSALDDSKKVVTMMRSKELLTNENFVRTHKDAKENPSELT